MTDRLPATVSPANAIEQALVVGDLSKLSEEQRITYYRKVCESLGLNPYTRPFDYLTLNGRLTLYARKDCTDQLRKINGVSIDKPDVRFEDDWIIVTVAAKDGSGRTDSDLGVVNRKDMRGDFGNALMKAVTKAKRRVTLSICGLGMLDETEVETIPDARIIETPVAAIVQPQTPGEMVTPQPIKPNGKPAFHMQSLLDRYGELVIEAKALNAKGANIPIELVSNTEDVNSINAKGKALRIAVETFKAQGDTMFQDEDAN